MSKNNTGLLLGGSAVALLLLAKTGILTSSLTNSTTSTTTSTNDPNKVIDAAGTLQKDIVNGYANYDTEIVNHPDLANPNTVLTQAQREQYMNNYRDVREGMQVWIQQNPAFNNDVYQAAQSHWTQYGAPGHRTFYKLIPSYNQPYIPPNPPQASNSSGGFWTGLLGAATHIVPLIGSVQAQQIPPPLSDLEIEILVTGSAIVKGILPFFEHVQPDYVNIVDTRIDTLLNYYLGIS